MWGFGRYRACKHHLRPTYDGLSPFAPNISALAIRKLTVLEIAMDPTIWMRKFFDPPPPMADANLTWVGDRGPDGKRVFFLHIRREE